MKEAKPVSIPLGAQFKLKKGELSKAEVYEMKKVPYASTEGSLMYAMVCTRPDITYAVGAVSRHLSNPGKEHWQAVKWIMRYLRGTSKMCLCFGSDKPLLDSYTDADMARDLETRRSTSGFVVNFANGAVSW